MSKAKKIFLIIIAIVFFGILYNDLILIPKKNKDYEVSCYWFTFTISSNKDGYVRDQFYSCIKKNSTLDNVGRCWKIYSPETINFLYNSHECPSNLYDSGRIIFK